MIVEDDEYNQKIIQRYLQELGVNQISVAATGKEAINLALQNNFNILLVDFTLPDINGIEVGRQIVYAKNFSGQRSF